LTDTDKRNITGKKHKLNTTQKSKQSKTQQNTITLLQSPLTTLSVWDHTQQLTYNNLNLYNAGQRDSQ